MRRIPNKIVGDADPEANVISCKTSSQIFTAAAAKEGINKIIKQSKRHTHTPQQCEMQSVVNFLVWAPISQQRQLQRNMDQGPRSREQGLTQLMNYLWLGLFGFCAY